LYQIKKNTGQVEKILLLLINENLKKQTNFKNAFISMVLFRELKMRNIVLIPVMILFIITLNGCFISDTLSIMGAHKEIDKSKLSAENEIFEEKTGVDLTHVKRGLWSMHNEHHNKMINLYYKSLLNNRLVYCVDNTQSEIAKQISTDNGICIIVNNEFFQDYTQIEKEIFLIASTSALALSRDTEYDNNNVSNVFYKCNEDYTPGNRNIINSQWFKERKVSVDGNGVVIN